MAARAAGVYVRRTFTSAGLPGGWVQPPATGGGALQESWRIRTLQSLEGFNNRGFIVLEDWKLHHEHSVRSAALRVAWILQPLYLLPFSLLLCMCVRAYTCAYTRIHTCCHLPCSRVVQSQRTRVPHLPSSLVQEGRPVSKRKMSLS